MTIRFKSKKKLRFKYVWFLIFILIIYVFVSLIKTYSLSYNDKLINIILKEVNPFVESSTNSLSDFIKYVISMDGIIATNEHRVSEISKLDELHFDIQKKPQVYIYNTHDNEKYLGGGNGVIEAAKLIEHKLNEINIPTIVDNRKVTPYLDTSYSTFFQAYAISRKYMVDILNVYNDFDLIIDLHRDSLAREYSYVTIDGINYAKVLFVQGVRYDHYKDNQELANNISNKLKEKYPGISKGIMIKDKDYQHDNYNQDLSSNALLLELGSNNSTWEEVCNTINVLVPIFEEVINEKESV